MSEASALSNQNHDSPSVALFLAQGQPVVRVGVLNSLSGHLAAYESLNHQATLMAISEINQMGGVMGYQIQPIVMDGGSKPSQFADRSLYLFTKEKIQTIFGGWASSDRKAMAATAESAQGQIWYPMHYEGLECLPNVFYTGACANQYLQPALSWFMQFKGSRLYLLSADGICSRTLSKLARAQIRQQGCVFLGEKILQEPKEFSEVLPNILQSKADGIICLLYNSQVVEVLRILAQQGITAKDLPMMTFRLTEKELQELPNGEAVGHFSCGNYFQSLPLPQNQAFVQRWRKYSEHLGAIPATAPIQSAYTQVYLWKQLVETAHSFDLRVMQRVIGGQSYNAANGRVTLKPNQHLQSNIYIGEANANGQFSLRYQFDQVEPLPWLGVEKLHFGAATLVVDMLGEITNAIQQNWQLEREAQELEATINQLISVGNLKGRNQLAPEITRAAMSKLVKANQRLQNTQLELIKTQTALQDANQELENRVEQRTQQLQQMIRRLQVEVSERQQIERRLRESRQRFEAIAANVPGVVYRAMLHPDGRLSMPYISPRIYDIFGLKPEEFLEHLEWVFDMAHPEDRHTLNDLAYNSAVTLAPFEHEYRVSPLFPKVKWVRIICQPQRLEGGEVVWDGVIVDITTQKATEDSLRQAEQTLQAEQERSEKLLQNMLPETIVAQLKSAPNSVIATRFEQVSVLFADIVNFSELSSSVSPNELVGLLNEIFSCFDMLAAQLGLEKIKTIGDAYMVVGGLPNYQPNHAKAIAEMALAMQREIRNFSRHDGQKFSLRIGINTGAVVAGVIGIKKFTYDLWGDAVNIASRMESQGVIDKIQVTEETYQLLADQYEFEQRPPVYIKGKGDMTTYFLLGNKNHDLAANVANNGQLLMTSSSHNSAANHGDNYFLLAKNY
ncbi:MAG: transporter substrate-binding protein [Pseudanabaena sp. ELA607]